MVEKCRFCGNGVNPDANIKTVFRCGTVVRGDRWWQDPNCLANTLEIANQRYEEILPVHPDCQDQLTPEICERLGMQDRGDGMWTVPSGFPTVFFSTHEPPRSTIGISKFTIHDMTAGQLSLLVAFARSRESQHEKGKTPA